MRPAVAREAIERFELEERAPMSAEHRARERKSAELCAAHRHTELEVGPRRRRTLGSRFRSLCLGGVRRRISSRRRRRRRGRCWGAVLQYTQFDCERRGREQVAEREAAHDELSLQKRSRLAHLCTCRAVRRDRDLRGPERLERERFEREGEWRVPQWALEVFERALHVRNAQLRSVERVNAENPKFNE